MGWRQYTTLFGGLGKKNASGVALEVAEVRVEDVRVLKYKLPPLVLLLLSKHPRGWFDDETVLAVVSDQPTCPAAASHVALSAIHPYPLSAHVPEVTMGYTVV